MTNSNLNPCGADAVQHSKPNRLEESRAETRYEANRRTFPGASITNPSK